MEDSGIDSDPKAVNHVEDERLFLGSDSSCSSNNTQVTQRNTTKQLQKKLEIRIEQAKRIQRNSDYIKLPKHDNENASSSAGLISIQRLPIPRKNKEHLPLVEYWHSESESEDEMTLFPVKSKDSSKHKQDLTDTFSIGELSDESEDSLNLDPAQPPRPFIRTYVPTGCFACHCHIL
ncbi:PREDICTED: uncharacterized protein LOC108778893 [Cyphomyrmex costatus]|uniref:Uncharacterized protein n=1 Tax=Cyphomyrmex costatus TaxID=456900 RepID=A0A151IBG2_9HYME|nr:PREDICTED: uncharacterized protein LOC108778893 [Cyphomyrmex costatus]XP_018401709.1 PREDICTED: uncharacterized protein LOC108778893 [Cyphomyrmex costatus]KYM96980.1 hypothetical protein ALC62_12357 [Cyphomyrmex costatus]